MRSRRKISIGVRNGGDDVYAENGLIPRNNKTLSPAARDAFLGLSDVRLQRIIDVIDHPGSCVVLTGEAGCGKSYLAQAAAHQVEAQVAHPVQCVIIDGVREMLRTYAFRFLDSPRDASTRILEALELRAQGRDLLIVALNIDCYDPEESAVIEQLVRARRARVICTAQQVVGAADRLARDPGVHQLAVEPFSLEESGEFLSRLLGVERISLAPLTRWHEAARGNQHALVTLALAADRRGVVQRVRKIAWVAARDDHAPIDFVTQLGELTQLELHALELIAFAAPMHEPMLLQLLDADSVAALLHRQVLTVHTDAQGITALTTHLPVTAAAIRAHTSPVRRVELASICYYALLTDDSTLTTASRLRLVRFGVEAGVEMPVDWVWQGMRAMARTGDLWFELRLALAAMPHSDPLRATEAIMRACDLAYFLNDRDSLDEAILALTRIISDPQLFDNFPFVMQFSLAMSSLCFDYKYVGRPEEALAAFDRWEAHWVAQGFDSAPLTQACRIRLLAFNGRLLESLTMCVHSTEQRNLAAEWVSAPARTVEALLRVQRGEFRTALTLAEHSRQLNSLYEISPTISGDLEGFTIFLAHWARGTTHSARAAVEALVAPTRPDLTAVHTETGLVELAHALFALQEARWYDAAELADRLFPSLRVNDPFRISPLLHAVSALAFAALGEADHAREELRMSDPFEPGLSSALRGFLGNITLRARHWLRDSDLETHARALADWARAEDMPLIELKALDVMAYAAVNPDPELEARASALAKLIDPPVGTAILAHILALGQPEAGDADVEERLLSELGIWMPLPPAGQLTGREREIALFTSLGYSSKYVAKRLHLSARTIETHLAHVYAKLGIAGREQLRQWFSDHRTVNE